MPELVPLPKIQNYFSFQAVGEVGMPEPPKEDDESLLTPDTQFFALLLNNAFISF